MEPLFEKVPSELDFPKAERDVLALWRDKRIFERTLDERQRGGGTPFVFYEGPPTANGLPHNGHVLTRVVKDLFPRYKTMRGHFVPRKAGWDTHGLPVEVEVEKELRIHGKAAIEEYGVEPFIAKCVQSVFRYTEQWERLTERIGFWVDLKEAYVTYHKSYVESVWWALSELFKKGLLYRGHKVVWWWAQGGTALSSGEVGLGYKTVDDPSVYVAFPLKDEPGTSLLVWTTTPWTLPSNMYAAVQPAFEYVVARATDGKKYVLAEKLVEPLAKKMKTELVVERSLPGSDLVGRAYQAPFDTFAGANVDPVVWTVIGADFVTLDAGTGIVHVAPAFGEDDHVAHKKLEKELGRSIELLCAVKSDGTFTGAVKAGDVALGGVWVKDGDKALTEALKKKGLLVHAEQYRHDYPFCWRADNDPLIQFARPAWYIRTTAEIKEAIENNQTIQWLPPHIKDGRFGDFLANNVDWALSRERYWGTPLNVWVCSDAPEHMAAPSSVAEIETKNPRAFDHFHAAKKADPSLSEHLIVHKPWIDQVTFPCEHPGCKGTMRRVPEVIDCWFDSGCMPFAQWGYPHTGEAEFKRSFPADFISEAIDQTRGWFYSLLMVSTLVFDAECQKRLGIAPVRAFPHPFKTCIVLGHVSDKEGKKESKSKGNYTPPEIILDKVEMEFAVVDGAKGVNPEKGMVTIAREDLEGMDLQEGQEVVVRGGSARDAKSGGKSAGPSVRLKVKAGKGMARRVAVVDAADIAALGVMQTKTPDVKPIEVPWLPPSERIVLEDPSSPAPGADAFRWFFYASNPPWSATRHSLSNVRMLQKEFLIKLRNVYSFFTIYAQIDGFDPHAAADAGPKAAPARLDQWIRSELAITVKATTDALDAYDVYGATQHLSRFVDALSNWYVRRSRARFWRAGWDGDKRAAYETLYASLVTVAALAAPFVPFMTEEMWQNLVVRPAKRVGAAAPESVHLAPYPTADEARIDPALSQAMRSVRDFVSLGLQVRTQAKIKVRQPLRRAHVLVAGRAGQGGAGAPGGMTEDLLEAMKEELNVVELRVVPPSEARAYVEYRLKPNFRTLGQRGLGKQAQELKKTMGQMSPDDAARLFGELAESGKAAFGGVELEAADVEIELATKDGFAAAGDRNGVVVLETAIDEELRRLGYARELVNRVQTSRKDMGLEYADRIRVVVSGGERLRAVVGAHGTEIAREVLATEFSVGSIPAGVAGREVDVEGEAVTLAISRI